MRPTRRLAVLACLWGLLLAGDAKPQQQRVEFVEPGTVTAVPGQTVILQLQNNTPDKVRVEVRVVDIAPADGTPLSGKITVTPDRFDLQPAGGAALNVSIPADLAADSLPSEVYVAAFEVSNNTFARRKIRIRRNAQGELPLEPIPALSEEWATDCSLSWWPPPFLADTNGPVVLEEYLPLKAGAAAGKLSEGQTLAVVVSEAGDSGVVEYAGKTKKLGGGVEAIQLRFKGSNKPGVYKSKFNAQTEDDKDDVKMSVTFTHHWVYPLVALSLGIGLAFALKHRYVGVSRPLLIAEENRAKIEEEFVKAQETFRRLHQGKPYLKYDIALAFRDGSSAVGKEITAIRAKSFSTIEAADLDKVNRGLEEMKEVVAKWGSFPERLARLEVTLTELSVTNATPRPPSGEPLISPAVAGKARQLLQGTELSLADFTRLNQQVIDTTERLQKWSLFNDSAAELWASVHKTATGNELKEVSDEKAEELKEVNGELHLRWVELWTRDDYDGGKKLEEFRGIGDSIKVLGAFLRDDADKNGVHNLTLLPAPVTGVVNVVTTAQANRQGATKKKVNWRPILDAAVIATPVAVAVYTGLSELYFGKAFGTPQDYLKAFFWGFGAQTVLTALIETLNVLWNSRSSVRAR